jgi:hypothetical protein
LLGETGEFDAFDNTSDQHSVSFTFEDSFALSGHGLYGALSAGAGSSLTGDAEEFSFFPCSSNFPVVWWGSWFMTFTAHCSN